MGFFDAFSSENSNESANEQWATYGDSNVDAPAALLTGIDGDDYKINLAVETNTTPTDYGAIAAGLDAATGALTARSGCVNDCRAD